MGWFAMGSLPLPKIVRPGLLTDFTASCQLTRLSSAMVATKSVGAVISVPSSGLWMTSSGGLVSSGALTRKLLSWRLMLPARSVAVTIRLYLPGCSLVKVAWPLSSSGRSWSLILTVRLVISPLSLAVAVIWRVSPGLMLSAANCRSISGGTGSSSWPSERCSSSKPLNRCCRLGG